jgi:LPXTG-site transpeptidase (sortase) family protein
MALFSYQKAPAKIGQETSEYIKVEDNSVKEKLTLGKLLGSFKDELMRIMVESKVAGFLIPLIMILFGINMIFKQVWPEIEQQIRLQIGDFNSGSLALVEGDYISREKYLSNPGSAYFKEITTSAQDQHILLDDPASFQFKGRFTITIPSLELNNLPVTANVESSDEYTYRNILNQGLAHFKGTGLPFSDVNNNIVIYGHSSSGDYYERTRDVAGAFSRLNKIKIGDIVEVTIAGKSYKYRVSKSKIVEPNETEIITGTTNKRTLTLFTCFPNGNSAQRFVAIANPI